MTDLIPADEFARSLNRTVRSIYDARYRGSDLPTAITIGKRLFFVQADIDDWISRKRMDALAERDNRERSVSKPLNLGRTTNGPRRPKSREPRALNGNRGPLKTASSKGVSYE